MKKWLLKMLMPKPEKLAVYAADAVRKTVNSAAQGREEAVRRYAALADQAAAAARRLAAIMRDAEIDEEERDRIAALLVPLMEKVGGLL